MSESGGAEKATNINAHRSQLPTSRSESSRHNSQGQELGNLASQNEVQRIHSSSPDRFDARFPRFQQPATAPVTIPGSQEATRLLSRESAQLNPSTSPPPRQFGNSAANPSLSSTRPRLGSAHLSPSPDPSRSWRGVSLDPTKRSVAIASASGRNSDTASRRFTFAGPTLENALAANQPYVEPGYAQLNPAYDQPANSRPIWGLGKPLPHILRSGMVPSNEELQEMQQRRDGISQAAFSEGVASARIDPTLRTHIIHPQLDNIRRDREIRLFESYRRQYEPSAAFSPLSRTTKSSSATLEGPNHPHRAGETIFEEDEEQPQPQRQPSELDLPQLREAMANVNQAREEGYLENAYQGAVPLFSYKPGLREIQNFHTGWSVWRYRFREPLAELLGITIQYILGFSANLSITVSRGTASVSYSADWAWGLATMIAIYIAAGASGGHFNPAISIMLCIFRGFPLRQVSSFIIAHISGAFLATMITFKLFQPGLDALVKAEGLDPQSEDSKSLERTLTLQNFITYPRAPWVTTGRAFCTELLGATILTVSVLALGDDRNSPPGAGMLAFIIGLLVALLGQVLGHNTGLALNPARDFGPRVAMKILGYSSPSHSLFEDMYWLKVAIAGPVCGALFGAFIYDALVFVGGESPVNYPRAR
ncbi:uncharacterized protein A1O9_11142 [Exophiala aquamarina CBS 119918]|uniref:Aquaglyceroporin like protein, other eukaryote n=1 Tax=Exophiala aquamarina CBS 119918 TaxID=1182545 RepID=A0A072PAY2_9EURO|nr:uncharacterized protein A1O9_11142 [Exophiala aquamarina CBS 119918]KEF52725.1 hypothetical protein A1O9_11142 [Exophiala aquamarina CBS 119918]